jgi:hypothetical protein
MHSHPMFATAKSSSTLVRFFSELLASYTFADIATKFFLLEFHGFARSAARVSA